MRTVTRMMKILAICCVCNLASHAQQAKEGNASDDGKAAGVTIELAKLEVTDSSLELSYRIRNGCDHDVWVCNEVHPSVPFEIYLTDDQQTLLMRKRLDVPCDWVWHRPPPPGTYIRLSPGAAQPESLLLGLPVTSHTVYAGGSVDAAAQTVRRLALEIGYYDQDLPALVRGIFAVAERFSPDARNLDPNIVRTYFPGLLVRSSLAHFDLFNTDAYDAGRVYMECSYETLGEKVLRLEIQDVAIPYGIYR